MKRTARGMLRSRSMLSALVLALAATQSRAAEDWLVARSNVISEVNVPLAKGDPLRIHDRTFQPLSLDASKVVPGLVWSADGSGCFVADAAGLLRRVSVPECRETLRHDMATRCSQLAMSGAGLAALLPDAQEIVLLGPRDLKISRRVKVPGANRIAAVPATVLVMVSMGNGDSLAVCNMMEGRLVRTVQGTSSVGFRGITMSPDGRWVFSAKWTGAWTKSGVVGDAVNAVQTGPTLDRDVACIVDPASKIVAMQSWPGRYYTLKMHDVKSILRPIAEIQEARMPAAFDADGKTVYARRDNALAQCSVQGQRLRDYVLGSDLVDIAVHPAGKGLMLRSDKTVWWSEVKVAAARTGPSVKPLDEPAEASRRSVGATTVARLSLTATPIVGEVLWSDDGSHAVCLHGTGLLSKIRIAPSGRVVLRADLGGPCSWLSRCALGLVVRVDYVQEVWILDEADFSLRGRFPLPGSGRLVSGPSLRIAVAELPGHPTGPIALVDLETGAVGPAVYWHPTPIACPIITPDGRYVIATGENKAMGRYAVRGMELKHEETSPEFGPPNLATKSWASVSQDSRLVAMATPSGGSVPSQFPPLEGPGIYAFDTARLSMPSLAIRSQFAVTCAAVDPVNRCIYAAQANGRLSWHDRKGTKIGDAAVFSDPPGTAMGSGPYMVPETCPAMIWDMTVHPAGGQLLAYSRDALFWVSLGTSAPVSVATGIAPTGSTTAARSPPPAAPRSVALQTRTVDDLSVTTVGVDVRTDEIGSDENFFWVKGGQYVLIADTTGCLHKIAVPELMETRAATVGRLGDIAISSAGIVVVDQSATELVVLDHDTLREKRRILAAGIGDIAASPVSPYVFASLPGDRGAPGPTTIIDAQKGKRLSFTGPPVRGSKRCTADGRYLVSCEGSTWNVCSINGIELRLLSSSESFPSRRSFWLRDSDDCLCIEGLGDSVKTNERYTGITLLKLPDLAKPYRVIPVPTGFVRRIDPASGAIYAQRSDGTVAVLDKDTLATRKVYRFTNPRQYPRIEFHPGGGRFFLCVGGSLLWAEPGPRAAGRDAAALAKAEADAEAAAAESPVGPTNATNPGAGPPDIESTLIRSRREAGRIRLVTLGVDAPNILPCMEWDPGTTNVFLLTKQGHLRKVSLPSCVQLRESDSGGACKSMALAKGGLLVAREDLPVIQIHDPATFDVSRKVALAKFGRIAASPVSAVAFVAGADPGPRHMTAIDTINGKILGTSYVTNLWNERGPKVKISKDAPREGGTIYSVEQLTMTPDGRYLFALSMDYLHRFKIAGAKLSYDESGAYVYCQGIAVSPDSRLVATVMDRVGEGRGASGSYGSRIFAADSIGQPSLKLAADSYATPVALAPQAGRIYVGEYGGFAVYTGAGKKLETTKLGGGRVQQILPSPSGREALVLDQGSLTWVDAGKVE